MRKRIPKWFFALVIALLLVSPDLYGKKRTHEVNLRGFSAFVRGMIKEWEVPGAAVSIVKNGKVVFAKGFGYRDVKKKLPVTPNTLFAIGSCTKAFTATILGILVDEGKLEWDKPVREYLTCFELEDPVASQQMTPVDLVTHRSGLPRHDLVWYNSSVTREELVHRLPFLEPSKGFRSTFQYNNLMFMTAGYMAGKIAGITWEKLVQKKIFQPLSMTNSNFSVKDSQKSPDFSLPYTKRNKRVEEIPFRNIDNVGPAGSINSSVKEMANWIILNLGKGKFNKKQVISSGNLQKIHAPQMVMGSTLSQDEELFYSTYGMGWVITAYRGHPLLAHGGGIDGFISLVSFFPQDNAGVVVLTNSDSGGGSLCSIVSYNVYDRILGLRQIPWSKRIKKRVEEAKKKAEEAKKKKKDERIPDTTPSHKLDAYAGNYENPGYGILRIKKEGDNLQATFNDLHFQGKHYHYDIFEFTSIIFQERKFKTTFHTDLKGNISKVCIPLQDGVEDIEFTRMPEKKMQDKAFLEKFVGIYQFNGVTGGITLKGESTLVLTVPGQPPYELVPYKGTEFTLKNLKGFSIKFILDASGQVTAFESHQPNGVFTAKKMK